jgi:hypothetical protein
MPNSGFFRNFLLKPQWQPFIERCRKTGNHPKEDLAKSGYKKERKKADAHPTKVGTSYPRLDYLADIGPHFEVKKKPFPLVLSYLCGYTKPIVLLQQQLLLKENN